MASIKLSIASMSATMTSFRPDGYERYDLSETDGAVEDNASGTQVLDGPAQPALQFWTIGGHMPKQLFWTLERIKTEQNRRRYTPPRQNYQVFLEDKVRPFQELVPTRAIAPGTIATPTGDGYQSYFGVFYVWILTLRGQQDGRFMNVTMTARELRL